MQLGTYRRTGRRVLVMTRESLPQAGEQLYTVDMVTGRVFYTRPENVEIDHEATERVWEQVRAQLRGEAPMPHQAA